MAGRVLLEHNVILLSELPVQILLVVMGALRLNTLADNIET
jgi:hypothetical protein